MTCHSKPLSPQPLTFFSAFRFHDKICQKRQILSKQPFLFSAKKIHLTRVVQTSYPCRQIYRSLIKLFLLSSSLLTFLSSQSTCLWPESQTRSINFLWWNCKEVISSLFYFFVNERKSHFFKIKWTYFIWVMISIFFCLPVKMSFPQSRHFFSQNRFFFFGRKKIVE